MNKVEPFETKRMAKCRRSISGWVAEMAAAKRSVRWECPACEDDHRVGDTDIVIPLYYSKIDGYWHEGSQPAIEPTCPTCGAQWRVIHGHSPEYSKFFTLRGSFRSLAREERDTHIFYRELPKQLLR